MARRWSKHEIDFLSVMYPVTVTSKLARMLGRTQKSIRALCSYRKINKKIKRKGRSLSGHEHKHYIGATNDGKQMREHVLVAERALGRKLPKGAQVHHVDGDKTNNKNNNLVICENAAYHKFLHNREKILSAGKIPGKHLCCSKCNQWKDIEEFYNCYKHKNLRSFGICKTCGAKESAEKYLLMKGTK